MEFKVESSSAQATESIAREFAKSLKTKAVIALYGDLGSGKTTFTKGFAKGLEIMENVSSPTFTIMNEYQGNKKLYHFDMYRLESAEEAIEAGFEEYFDLRKLDGICVVEWPENVKGLLPIRHIDITFVKTDKNTRSLIFSYKGEV